MAKLIPMAKDRYPATSVKGFLAKAMEELKEIPYPEFIKRDYYYKLGEGSIVMYII
jgi:hypothetical protein